MILESNLSQWKQVKKKVLISHMDLFDSVGPKRNRFTKVNITTPKKMVAQLKLNLFEFQTKLKPKYKGIVLIEPTHWIG